MVRIVFTLYSCLCFFKFRYIQIYICIVMVNFWNFLSFWEFSEEGAYSISCPSEVLEYFFWLIDYFFNLKNE